MKKYSLLIMVLIILVGLASCNLDPANGIYRSIANSSEIISTGVTEALGFVDNTAYFLSDDGIYSKSEGNESVKLVSKSPSILSASFTRDKNDILFLNNTTSNSITVYSYNLANENTTELSTNTAFDDIKIITNNSFFITQDDDNPIEINYIEGFSPSIITNSNSSITTLTKVLTSKDSILVLGIDASDDYIAELYSYSPGSIAMNTITYKNYIGFEYYNDSNYILIDEDNEIYYDNTDADDSIEATVYDLYSGQLASFSVGNYVYFKGEEYFHRVKTDGTNKAFILGFAGDLQYDIIDILPGGTADTFIVFTLESGIFKLSGVTTSDSSGTVTEF